MIERLFWDDNDAIDRIEQGLRNDAIIVTTTDTVLGLLAPVNMEGFDKLNHIKQRRDKPYLLLTASLASIIEKIQIDNLQIETFMKKCWPGPVTLILPAARDLPFWMTAGKSTIAVRIPDHAGLLELLSRFDALFSTSANVSDAPVAESPDDLDDAILSSALYIVVDKNGTSRDQASTILDCTGDSITVVREGSYPINVLEGYWGRTFIRKN